jgi:hypothetical protein
MMLGDRAREVFGQASGERTVCYPQDLRDEVLVGGRFELVARRACRHPRREEGETTRSAEA